LPFLLAAETGASQIVLGTDYPYPWTQTAVDHILGTPGLSDGERVAMLGATAAQLLEIPAYLAPRLCGMDAQGATKVVPNGTAKANNSGFSSPDYS
jgi:hypothetical protein